MTGANRQLPDAVDIDPAIRDALAEGQPVVALETTVISHGLPYPQNLETARAMIDAVESAGATPAPIGILDGRIRVGLTPAELERFATDPTVVKASARDIPVLLALAGSGATTVAATMRCAALAGIEIFATGGIGGVHRDAMRTFDISADLVELARSPVAVVCSGAKSILDLPKTLEALETAGVPVVGLGVDRFPGFHVRDSGLALGASGNVESIASIVDHATSLGCGGVLVANPIPAEHALDAASVERWVSIAVDEAARDGVEGKALTPYLLDRLADLSGGATLDANQALLVANARAAAAIAIALAARRA